MMRAVEVQPLDRLLSAGNKRLCELDHRAKPIAAAAAITSKTLVHPDEETSFSERRRSEACIQEERNPNRTGLTPIFPV